MATEQQVQAWVDEALAWAQQEYPEATEDGARALVEAILAAPVARRNVP